MHPAGAAIGWKMAHAEFSPIELSVSRNSIAAHGGAGIVFLDGAIDGQRVFHACRMMDAHRAVGAKAIVLDVRSEGGNVPAGLAVIRAIERLRAAFVPTIAHVGRYANSMASVIAVACDYAVIAPGATMHVHEAQGGNPEHLAILRAKLLDTYEARTLMGRGQLAGYLAGEVTLDAYAAHSHGFVDEVAGPKRLEEIARAAAAPGGLFSAPVRAANSWRRHVLNERRADAEGVYRWGTGR